MDISLNKISIFILALIAFAFQACYVAFQHPQVEEYKWGQVQHNDDCRDCHQDFYAESVLPDAAVDDNWWDYYSNSAWWEEKDLSDFMGSDPAPAAGTGNSVLPGSYGPSTPAWNPGAVTTSGSSLGKKTTNESDNESSKRSSGSRRSTAQGSDDDSNSDTRRSNSGGSR